jgi:hypothetical protein
MTVQNDILTNYCLTKWSSSLGNIWWIFAWWGSHSGKWQGARTLSSVTTRYPLCFHNNNDSNKCLLLSIHPFRRNETEKKVLKGSLEIPFNEKPERGDMSFPRLAITTRSAEIRKKLALKIKSDFWISWSTSRDYRPNWRQWSTKPPSNCALPFRAWIALIQCTQWSSRLQQSLLYISSVQLTSHSSRQLLFTCLTR